MYTVLLARALGQSWLTELNLILEKEIFTTEILLLVTFECSR